MISLSSTWIFIQVYSWKSGIYHLYGISGQSTECFFYGTGSERQEDSRAYVSRDNFIRYDNNVKYAEDFDQYMYYEAGQTYYVAPVFFDIDDTEHLLRFRIDYYGTYKEYLAQASNGTFTYNENADGSIGNIISISNIKVALGNDGFYHPTDNNGNVINDEYIYADFKYTTGVFSSNSLEQIIEKVDLILVKMKMEMLLQVVMKLVQLSNIWLKWILM